MTTDSALTRIRREPPRFRTMAVRDVERLTPRMARVIFAGEELAGLTVDDPAASVRLLLPSSRGEELVMPAWNGNEFLLPDGERPVIRTFTPYRAAADELELWIVLHEGGAASSWAEHAGPGDPAAVSGPGRGYEIDGAAPSIVLAGDETAIPAIAQLMAELPPHAHVQVDIEVVDPAAELPLPEHPRAVVEWHDLSPDAPPGATLAVAVQDADLDPAGQVWAAGEAAGMQRIRKLLARRDFPRRQSTVRGYWKRRDA